MKHIHGVVVSILLLCCSVFSQAQQSVATVTNAVVPPLVKFSGVLTDLNGNPLSGTVGVTFALYKDQQGGAPLWLETQNVQLDKSGHYSAMLGSTSSAGLPAEIFEGGEARWLGFQPQGQAERPRVLLLSVPYALKAGDAQTLGGLPSSAFVLAVPAAGGVLSATTTVNPISSLAPTSIDVTTSGGTINTLPLFSTATDIENSAVIQTGSGSTARIGIGTTTPSATLDVNGGATIRGLLNLPAAATANDSGGSESRPFGLVASTYNGGSATAANQVFHWQAEPVGNNTASPSATLNLLFATAPVAPVETGLKIANTGIITFASGQTFPGVSGTITGVTAGTDLAGGGNGGNVTLNLDTTKVPQLATSNTFNGEQFFNNKIVVKGLSSFEVLDVVNTTGSGSGIEGVTASATGFGVVGEVTNTATSGVVAGVLGTSAAQYSDSGPGYGVVGKSPTMGVYGASSGVSNIGQNVIAGMYQWVGGVWGDTGAGGENPSYIGVLGTADNNPAASFLNKSPVLATLSAYNFTTTSGAPVFETSSGFSNATCIINVNADLTCSGKVSSVVPAAAGGRMVSLYAVQSPENWFEDFGSGTLVNGAATVALDPAFAQTVNTTIGYHIFLTPKGESEGLYVSNETPQGFEVHEQRGGRSGVAFDYRIVAKRNGFEDVRLADVTDKYRRMEKQGQQPQRRMAQHRAEGAATNR